ncbi:hypothetical protein [Clostridium sp.]|uniref:hypothetical protein n=1 Tax=Clostridium sp. TaxID=1506 RepID=UPI00262A4212|nr:hypothetical protein [Clostridium sp.]
MIVLMNLSEKTKNYLIYSFGNDEKNLDGKVKIPLDNPKNFEVLKESKFLSNECMMRGLVKAIRFIQNGEIKECIDYIS